MQPEWLKQRFTAQATAASKAQSEPEQPSALNRRHFLHSGMLAGVTAGLAAERVYEFAYIFSPLRLKGATGSPGSPIAVA